MYRPYKIMWLSDSPLIPCYDTETEVLTNNGWKLFKDCEPEDKFYTLNPETHEIELHHAEKIVRKKYKGKMYKVENNNLNLCTTPNHKMYVGKKNRQGEIKYRLEEAEKVESITTNYYLRNGEWKTSYPYFIRIKGVESKFEEINQPYDVRVEDYVEALAYYLADGYYLDKKHGYRIEIRKIDEEDKKRIGKALQKITQNKVCYNNRGVYVNDKRLWTHLKKFGRTKDKFIPDNVKNLSSALLELFWYSYAFCDGLKQRPETIFTSSKNMRDDLQEIALKMGYSANWFERKEYSNKVEGREIKQTTPNYRLSLIKNRNQPRPNKKTKQDKWIDYDDYVWCAVVPPNHIIYVRREGKPVWCGNTGYANQSRAIVGDLAKKRDLDMYYIGAQHRGMPMWMTHNPHRAYNTKFPGSYKLLGSGKKDYAEDILPRYLKKDVVPDLSIVLLDSFMLHYMVNPAKHNGGTMDIGPSKWLFYFPSDGHPLPMGFEKIMKKMDYRVAMAKWGQKQAKDLGFKDTMHIPHGVDKSKFHPLPKQAQPELRKKYGFRPDDFVALSVFRNQGRKMPSRLIKAWAKFVKDKDDAFLLLHSDPKDPARPMEINQLAYRLGVQNTIRWTGMTMTNPFTTEELNELYNIADIHVLSTTGEGFGVIFIEAMAAGTPNLAPDFTTPKELFGNKYGYLAEVNTTLTGSYNVERGIVDINSYVEKLNEVYNDRSTLKYKGKKSVNHVVENYSWREILPKWHKLIKKIREE